MKNLKNRIEVIEEDLQKKEIKRQQEQKVRKVVTEAKNIKIERIDINLIRACLVKICLDLFFNFKTNY